MLRSQRFLKRRFQLTLEYLEMWLSKGSPDEWEEDRGQSMSCACPRTCAMPLLILPILLFSRYFALGLLYHYNKQDASAVQVSSERLLWASKVTRRVRAPANQGLTPRLSLRTYGVGRTNIGKLSSDLHMCTEAHRTSTFTHTHHTFFKKHFSVVKRPITFNFSLLFKSVETTFA